MLMVFVEGGAPSYSLRKRRFRDVIAIADDALDSINRHTNAVSLTKEHRQEVLKQISGALNEDIPIKKLLRISLGLEQSPDSSELPVEF